MAIIKVVIKKYWPLFLLGLVSYIVIWPLLMPGYFSHHDDLQVMRIFEMRKCFIDLQIPCRWVPDMGLGNGFPLFNYYSALPYYIGAIFSIFMGYITAAKILFFMPLILGIISMYYLAKELFGDRLAVLSAVLFGLAPYRALDSYVRGDIAESWSIAIAPLLFLWSLKLIKVQERKYFIYFGLILAGFLITHNIMTLFFIPVLLIWIILQSINYKNKKYLPVVLSIIIGFGLASFFLIPAFMEKNLVQTETLISGDLNFRAHFATLNQLFLSRFWGYGASVPGPNDTISFQIGWPLWWLIGISLGYLILKLYKTKKADWNSYFLILIFVFSVFMTHIRSAFIWERVPLLAYAQFPWRFLALSIFSGSLLGVVWLKALKPKLQIIAIIFISLLTIIFNASFFKPEIFYPFMTDQQKLSGYEFLQQQQAAILDYLPKGIPKPTELASSGPIIHSGSAQISNFQNHSNFWQFNIQVNKQVRVEVPVFDFPNWTVFGKQHEIAHNSNNRLKRIMFDLNPGQYLIMGKLENTSIRTLGNILTLLALGFLVGLSILWKKWKNI